MGYLRSLEGFVAAAGQVVLSLIVLSRGVLIHSRAQTIHFLTTPDLEQRESFLAAERTPKWYWGLIQVVSLLFSIVSLLQTVVFFQRVREKAALCLETLCGCPVLCGYYLLPSGRHCPAVS